MPCALPQAQSPTHSSFKQVGGYLEEYQVGQGTVGAGGPRWLCCARPATAKSGRYCAQKWAYVTLRSRLRAPCCPLHAQDFTFLTIRSAGHEAPYTGGERPLGALLAPFSSARQSALGSHAPGKPWLPACQTAHPVAPCAARDRTYMVYQKWLQGEDIVPADDT